MPKLKALILLPLLSFFLLISNPGAFAEDITITTYYPAPYGVYNEMRAKKMAVGDTYYDPATTAINDPADLIVEGSVGIGTASPTIGSSLHVKDGHIRVENGSFVDDGTTLNVPDYVFEPGYNLKSLSEVEKFLLKYKHLEGLPAMGDIEGWAKLSMQDRDMRLLEKIEELTLYIIELEKRIGKR